MALTEDVLIRCPVCREKQWLEIDLSAGDFQQFIQDCEICCRPLSITASQNGSKFRAEVTLSDM